MTGLRAHPRWKTAKAALAALAATLTFAAAPPSYALTQTALAPDDPIIQALFASEQATDCLPFLVGASLTRGVDAQVALPAAYGASDLPTGGADFLVMASGDPLAPGEQADLDVGDAGSCVDDRVALELTFDFGTPAAVQSVSFDFDFFTYEFPEFAGAPASDYVEGYFDNAPLQVGAQCEPLVAPGGCVITLDENGDRNDVGSASLRRCDSLGCDDGGGSPGWETVVVGSPGDDSGRSGTVNTCAAVGCGGGADGVHTLTLAVGDVVDGIYTTAGLFDSLRCFSDAICQLPATSECGNGIVELPEVCDDGNLLDGDCCSSACGLEPSTTVCRATVGECDAAEQCTGFSAECPADAVFAAGVGCGDDGNACTDDICDGAGACAHPDNSAPCDDGLFCNGADLCDQGACDLHAGDPCSGGGECGDLCNEVSQHCFDPLGSACADDGNACTTTACDGAGACHASPVAAATPCPDDGNGCTDDRCDGAGTCAHPPNLDPCDDGVFCNGVDTCAGGSCSTHSGDPCLGNPECGNVCEEDGDTCLVPAGVACSDDGDACTADTCDGQGSCTSEIDPDAGPSCACEVTFEVDSAVPLGSLQFNVDYSAAGEFTGVGESVDCTSLLAGALVVPFDCAEAGGCGDVPADTLAIGVISTAGVDGPVDAASCWFGPPADARIEDLVVTVVEAVDTGAPAAPAAATVTVAASGCFETCGDSVLDLDEDCDDGNRDDGDCCSSDCRFELSGAACGDAGDDGCSAPDTCDGAGACLANHEPAGFACGDSGTECVVQDGCDGAGLCVDGGFVPAATPCGSAATSVCTSADACDGAGTCQPNHAPAGTACGSSAVGVCDAADTCDGAGACSMNRTPDGTVCEEDALFCTSPGMCTAGVCEGQVNPCGSAPGCEDTCSEEDGACRLCGFPLSNSRCTTNAVFLLQCSTFVTTCELCTSDADSNGIVTASDALIVLRHCLGLPPEPMCPLFPPAAIGQVTSSTTTTVTPPLPASTTTTSTLATP